MPDDRAQLGRALRAQGRMEMARLMRWVLGAVVVLAFAPSAFAEDFVLRGSAPTYHWGGFYGGGQLGYSSSVINFGTAVGPDIAEMLRNTSIEQDEQISQWSVLGSRNPVSNSYGAFVGYNYEWQSVILGMEVNYNHFLLSANSSGAMERSFTDSGNLPAGHHLFYDMNVSGQSSFRMTDAATFRARIGWEAGHFLPYFFGGLAVGRVDTSSSATIAYTAVDFPDSEEPPLVPLYTTADPLSVGPESAGLSQSGEFTYGFATGLGIDFAVTANLFVRGEFEYIFFAPVNGAQISMSTARVGAGFKF
jgi:outer membrane immunogenic protein